MKHGVIWAVGLLLLAGGTALAATDYDNGIEMGRVKLQQEFQARGNDCARLTEAVGAAQAACATYPNPQYAAGCRDGVQGYYDTVQWTICRPSGDQCDQIGEDAADIIAAKACHVVYGALATKADPNRQACFNAAKPKCESSIRNKLNAMVSSGSCYVDEEHNKLRTEPFEIYDVQFAAIRSECDATVGGILGLPSEPGDAGLDVEADAPSEPDSGPPVEPDAGPAPDPYSGVFNVSENVAAKQGTTYPGYPQALSIVECDKRSSAIPDCFGWTYEHATGRCFPQTIQSSGKYVSMNGYTSGIRKVGFSGSFLVYDVAYLRAGNDLPEYPKHIGLFDCDRACSVRLDCWGWTWARSSGQCWLKNWNARGGLINGNVNYVTGVRP